MSDQFLAEIRIFPFDFVPEGWAFCDGQLIPIVQNTALYALLGTNYGGDGRTTFALPDLRNGAALHPGQGPGLSIRNLGEKGGSRAVALIVQELPAHTHFPLVSPQTGTTGNPTTNVWSSVGADRDVFWYKSATPDIQMNATASGIAGSSQPHNNMMPYLNLSFCIALQGVFPPRS